MTEGSAKTALVKMLRNERFHVVAIQDRFTAGIPDLAVSRNGRTMWLELKLFKFKDAFPDYLDICKYMGSKEKGQLRAQQIAYVMEMAKHADARFLLMGAVKTMVMVSDVSAHEIWHHVTTETAMPIIWLRRDEWIGRLK